MRKHVLQKYKGKTFAEASRLIEKKFKNRNTDDAEMKAFQAEIAILQAEQEKRRMELEAEQMPQQPMMAMGGRLPKYVDGGWPLPLAPSLAIMNADWHQGNVVGPNVPPPNVPPIATAASDPPTPSLRMPFENSTLPIPSNYGSPLQPMTYNNTSNLPAPIPYSSATDTKNLRSEMERVMPNVNLPEARSRRPFLGGIRDWATNNVMAPMAIGKGIEALAKGIQLAGGYDTVDPQLNPHGSRIASLMANRRINMDSVRNEAMSGYNRTIEGSTPVRSQAVRQAIGSSAGAQLTRGMADISLREQDANNQYRAQEAQSLDSLGQQTVQARQYAEQLNNQSKAVWQGGLQNMFESIGNAGQQITNFRANLAQQQLLANALRTADFKIDNVSKLLREAVNNKDITDQEAIVIANMIERGADRAQVNAQIERYRQGRQKANERLTEINENQ